MSSGFYDLARQSFAVKQIDWTTDVFKVVLVDTTLYTVNKATDQFLAIIPVGARISTSAQLTTPTATIGVLDADDVAFAAVTGSNMVIVIFLDTGVAATSRLILYIDTGPGLPVASAGGPILITWDNTANKIGKL